MAHFAQLDENNVVTQVIVVDNKDTSDVFGVEKEHIGAAFCEKLLGGRWVRTSYNSNFRKRYAGIGMTHNEELDAFIGPKPFASWVLNNETADWEAPTPMPAEGRWEWDEGTTSWKEIVNESE